MTVDANGPELIGTTGDGSDELRYDLVLSGGGMRSALCSLGALIFLRHSTLSAVAGADGGTSRSGLDAIDRIVSASGGSVVNAGLLLKRPGTEPEWDAFIGAMLARATRRRRVFAVLAVWALSAAFVVGAKFWPATPSRCLGVAALAITAVYVWLVFWLRARVTPPLLVLAVMFAIINFDVPDRGEWLILLAVTFVVPVVGIGVFALARRRALRRSPDPPNGRARRWMVMIGLAHVLLALGMFAAAMLDPPWGWLDPVRQTLWSVVFLAIVLQLVGSFLLRSHLAYLIAAPHQRTHLGGTTAHGSWGFAWAKALRRRRGPVQRNTRGNWLVTHVIASAEIREDAATYFVSGPANDVQLSEGVGLQRPRLADARTVEVLTALHASVAFPGVLSAAYPVGTKHLDHPSRPPGDAPVPPVPMFADALSLPVLIDAGVHGTLVTAFEFPRGLPDEERAAYRAYLGTAEARRRKLVIDATASRKSLLWWPTVLIPRLSDRVMTKRIGDMVLRRLVDLERERLRQVDPLTGRRDLYVAATGADANYVNAQDLEGEWQDELYRLRQQADDVWMWWPGKNQATACIDATLAACVEATRCDVEPRRTPAQCMALFDVLKSHASRLSRDPSPNATPRWPRFRAGLMLLLTLVGVGLTCFGWAPEPIEAAPHPFFDLASARRPMVISHQGGLPQPTLSGFRSVRGAGVTVIETDLRLTADGVLVARHGPFLDRTCLRTLARLRGDHPDVATAEQLLTDPRLEGVNWLFEINLGIGSTASGDMCDDEDVIEALVTTLEAGIAREPALADRVCFQFGRTVDGSERRLIEALNEALNKAAGPDLQLCRCLDNQGRVGKWDGAIRSLWEQFSPPDVDRGVSCVALEALGASKLDVAQARGLAPTVLEWFVLRRTGEPSTADDWAEHDADRGFDGYIVDDPTPLIDYVQRG